MPSPYDHGVTIADGGILGAASFADSDVGQAVPQQAVLPLAGATIHAAAGGVIAWQNPESVAIYILRVLLDVTTIATGACTLDIGTTATDATTTSDNLIDGVDAHVAGLYDNLNDAGSNGKARQKLAAGKWVTVDEKTGDATGLVGNLYIQYIKPTA